MVCTKLDIYVCIIITRSIPGELLVPEIRSIPGELLVTEIRSIPGELLVPEIRSIPLLVNY